MGYRDCALRLLISTALSPWVFVLTLSCGNERIGNTLQIAPRLRVSLNLHQLIRGLRWAVCSFSHHQVVIRFANLSHNTHIGLGLWLGLLHN